MKRNTQLEELKAVAIILAEVKQLPHLQNVEWSLDEK